MAVQIKFDINNNPKQPSILLCSKDHVQIGKIPDRFISDIVFTDYLNNGAEFTCSIHKSVNGETLYLWDTITDFKLIYVKEYEKYFEITVSLNDGEETVKSLTCTVQSKAELSNIYLYNIEINTESDIAASEKPTILYNPADPKASLLDRVLEKAVHYNISHVDSTLMNIQRTFSADDTTIYDFLTSTLSDEIGCLIEFDEINRSILIYDLYTTCSACGYRGDYSEHCPECESVDLTYGYGEDTTIFISKNRLGKNISLQTQTDQVKNCFKLAAGDDDMTAAVVNSNLGGSYIYYLSDDAKQDMPQELVSRLNDYDELVKSYQEEYLDLTAEEYRITDEILYNTSGMMPDIKNEETTALLEAAKLTAGNLSPMGLTEVKASTSTATVNTALKKYAKVFIHSGKYKIDINQGEFVYTGKDSEGYSYGSWYGNFIVTNYSGENDTALSEMISVKVYNHYDDFMTQKILKNIKDADTGSDDDGSIFNVLLINDLKNFKNALTLYCLNRLDSFYDAIQSVINILCEADQAGESADLYEPIYIPYLNKLKAVQSEIDIRAATVDSLNQQNEDYKNQKFKIKEITNLQNFLGEDLWKKFMLYGRESRYENSNYISSGLDNTQLLEKAQEFLTLAKTDIYKSGNQQLSLSTELNNLLVIKEFRPLVDKFACGNWLRIKCDNKIYKLRLLSYTIEFNTLSSIYVEFSDVRKIKDNVNVLENILNQAQSMASTYSNYQSQAGQGKTANDVLKNWVDKGLDATNVKIVSNADNQNMIYDQHGLLCRRYDDILETYYPTQLKLFSDGIYITKNNWESIEAAIGRIKFFNTSTGETIEDYGVNAKYLIGKWILGENMEITNSAGNFSITKNGLSSKFYDDVVDNLGSEISQLGNKIVLKVNSDGKLAMVSLDDDANTGTAIKLSADDIKLDGYVTFSNLSASGGTAINGNNITTGVIQSANYNENTSGTKLDLSSGMIDTKYFKVASDGSLSITGGIIDIKGTSDLQSIIQLKYSNYSTSLSPLGFYSYQTGGYSTSIRNSGISLTGLSSSGNTSLVIQPDNITTINNFTINTGISNLTIESNGIELYHYSSNSSGTPFIDFHYDNNDNVDYTMRIINSGRSDQLHVLGGHLYTDNGNMYAYGFENLSSEELKTNIEKYKTSTIDLINSGDIYIYNYKELLKSERGDKIHYGFVIGESYKTPKEIIDVTGKSIDLYNVCGILWKAVQELSAEIKQLKLERVLL